MADKLISSLTNATTLAVGDEIVAEILSNGNSRAITAGVAGVAVGTAFGTPSTNDRLFRTDLGLGYYYDGTRWLSTQVFTLMPGMIDASDMARSSSGTVHYAVNPWLDLHDIYVETVAWWWTLTGSGNWTMAVHPVAAGVAGSAFGSKTVSSAGSDGDRIAVGAVHADTNERFQVTLTENSGTATLYCQAAMIYRLVG